MLSASQKKRQRQKRIKAAEAVAASTTQSVAPPPVTSWTKSLGHNLVNRVQLYIGGVLSDTISAPTAAGLLGQPPVPPEVPAVSREDLQQRVRQLREDSHELFVERRRADSVFELANHGSISFETTVSLLRPRPAGTYLFKASNSKPGEVVLAFRIGPDNVEQSIIERTDDGRFSLGPDRVFPSISSIVAANAGVLRIPLRKSWYDHGVLSTTETLERLKHQPAGTFLVRQSLSTAGAVVIAFKTVVETEQWLATLNPSGVYKLSDGSTFGSIDGVIDAYSGEFLKYPLSPTDISYHAARARLLPEPRGTYLLRYDVDTPDAFVLASKLGDGDIQQFKFNNGPEGLSCIGGGETRVYPRQALLCTCENESGVDAIIGAYPEFFISPLRVDEGADTATATATGAGASADGNHVAASTFAAV